MHGVQVRRKPYLAPGGMERFARLANLKTMQTRIREWRKIRDLTLEEVAPQIGMSAGNLSRLERGLIPYTQPALEALAVVLQVRPAQLLEGDNSDPDRERLTEAYKRLSKTSRSQALKILAAMAETGHPAE